jgi:hypothetical protein
MRMKFDDEGANVQSGDQRVDRSQGAARAISVSFDLLDAYYLKRRPELYRPRSLLG